MIATALKRVKKSEKGFTLIELLAVIVILGVIAAIAIPLISNVISKSKTKSDFATARQIYDATRIFVTAEKNGEFKESGGLTVPIKTQGAVTGLQEGGYLEPNIVLPSSKEPITGGEVKFLATGELLYVKIVTGTDKTTFYKGSEVLKGEGDVITNNVAPTSP
ncbi:type II secretion system protein [Paenibacillus nasutitermitis]|uniref:Prepilin-type N-terminal cleavage/methylation domain-containing protein n=1 Tax=Paenibacillus nasutitermitis TaxID=1652958 RepID=A0A916YJQ1_9BACL|nr:type II secretion system protein [Paenibacillus nasutitermitis]GGD48015.1 hypothetical protein GCM10010911_01940 [Paenibacillus nasutitermitis]